MCRIDSQNSQYSGKGIGPHFEPVLDLLPGSFALTSSHRRRVDIRKNARLVSDSQILRIPRTDELSAPAEGPMEAIENRRGR
jgi:hypothetical protein